MPGAVHGLEREGVPLDGEGEHVFAVVLPVARRLPQFAVVDVRGGHFLKASSPILVLQITPQEETPVNPSFPGWNLEEQPMKTDEGV